MVIVQVQQWGAWKQAPIIVMPKSALHYPSMFYQPNTFLCYWLIGQCFSTLVARIAGHVHACLWSSTSPEQPTVSLT